MHDADAYLRNSMHALHECRNYAKYLAGQRFFLSGTVSARLPRCEFLWLTFQSEFKPSVQTTVAISTFKVRWQVITIGTVRIENHDGSGT